jgi:hypothetical protein
LNNYNILKQHTPVIINSLQDIFIYQILPQYRLRVYPFFGFPSNTMKGKLTSDNWLRCGE